MSLREYKKKRIFTQTPEPSPNTTNSKKSDLYLLRFVIQKHEASHLHYDFRLEVNGVLKSWAVPKGPSLDPGIKRLAMRVEDHPYDYKDFEGVIPKGNYGAGNVMIWDEGVYAPMSSENHENDNEVMSQQLKKGHLDIFLNGNKLKGRFNLIKLAKADKESWLLIKYKDKFSSKEDILKQDKSVRSDFTMQQINSAHTKNKSDTENKADTVKTNFKANINLKHTPKTAMPKRIKPMLATLVTQAFSCPGWLFEIKWDGYRIIAYINKQKVSLLSRNQQDYTDIFSPVSQELSTLKLQAVVDGEMVVLDEEGRPNFQLLQQYQKTGDGQLCYYIFDLIWLEGHDVRGLPLIRRKQLLKEIIPSGQFLAISDYIEEEGESFYKTILDYDLEGVVAKEVHSEYLEGKRSRQWLKIKHQNQQEAVIAGFTAPRGSRKNIGALILGVYKNEELVYIGHVGGGLTESELADLKIQLDKLICNKLPFKTKPKTNMPVTWVKPKLVCEVNFKEWTRDGLLRFPIFLRLRKDKNPKEIIREKAKTINEQQLCPLPNKKK